jgi:UDP:flavonoid glycosyltransferase YjiC (YdhE family)
LPSEYKEFLQRFPKGSVLVAFGTTFQPTMVYSKILIETFKKMPDRGFVVGLKHDWHMYKVLEENPLPNVYFNKFIPQKELLNDPRIEVFISHGGGASILETIYFGKPIIVCPIASD